jgi:hypothetical protein
MSNNEKIIIDVYGSNNAPAAADHRRGATTIEEVRQATEAGRELSDHQSTTRGEVRREH